MTLTTNTPRLTSLSHGGGCGCKIAPGLLTEILKGGSRLPVPPELLVGIETSDDAAVYKLNDEQALIATTDFFMPIVDDPYQFGRIAATNAISDVYAMGGTPIFALALVGMPISVASPRARIAFGNISAFDMLCSFIRMTMGLRAAPAPTAFKNCLLESWASLSSRSSVVFVIAPRCLVSARRPFDTHPSRARSCPAATAGNRA